MKIKQEIFEIMGAELNGVNPLPSFRARKCGKTKPSEDFPENLKEGLGHISKPLPYLMQDRYTRERKLLRLKSFVLENEYLKVTVLPEYGGRIHAINDKIAGKELLFTNPVIQPGNLAIRNAWLSGGIEWNFGLIGHSPITCDNIYAAILEDGEGNDFLRIYEFERTKSAFWQLDLHLPEGSQHLMCHVRLMNPFDVATTTYWWTNIAVTDDFNTRVLASNKYVMSFDKGLCCYDRLPEIRQMPGIDATYPRNATNAFDYFIQKDREGESTWEAAAYNDGLVFYERSTAPLYYKKLFVWGAHRAGYHWQEFLSNGEGTGYYAEIQAGIAPSQCHDKMFPARSKFEWTQCFGGVSLDPAKLHDPDYDKAVDYCGETICERMSEELINDINKYLMTLADIPVKEENIVHNGSGFGALEIMRMKKDGDGTAPATILFPEKNIGKEEEAWLTLLNEGYIPELSPSELPVSYMISEKWLPKIVKSLETEKGNNWTARMHLGVSLYDLYNLQGYVADVMTEEEERSSVESARIVWNESIEQKPSIIAYRNLAFLENKAENFELAEKYYDAALAMEGAYDDYALVSEYLRFLSAQKKYEKVWEIYGGLPENCKKVDRIRITVAKAAVKLHHIDYLEGFFAEEHYDIREGEVSLTDIWFEFCALKMAAERGITDITLEVLDNLIDEAWDIYPPDKSIDFRMTVNKKNRYRVSAE